MAKTIITRIKNKVDTLAKWSAYTGTLLDGEIAVVRVPTGETYTNPVTGIDEPVVELLMKVGDGTSPFANLPWMSAKASDVYDWAKATTVEFNPSTYKMLFKDAGGNSILAVDLTSIDARLDALESTKITVTPNDSSKPGVVQSVTQGDATHEIDVTYGLIKTADIDAKQVTAAKIADSTITATQLAGSAVSTAKIADGAVTDAKVSAGVSSDKISVGAGTLTTKLESLDASLAGVKGSISVSPASATSNAVVQGVTYDNSTGVFTVTYGTVAAGDIASSAVTTAKIKDANVTAAKLASDSVTTAKIADGAVTNAKLGTDISSDKIHIGAGTTAGTLSAKISAIDGEIASLKTSVAGGVHFVGVVTAAPNAASVTVNGSTTHTAAAGDVVLWAAEGREYIYTGSAWEELGDVTRIGELETKINNLDVTTTNAVATTNKFVSQVTQTDGKIAVTYTQPTSANVSHSGSTVSAALGAHNSRIEAVETKLDGVTKVTTSITNAINELDVSAPSVPTSGTTTATAFIDSVSQTNGKITATKKNLPTASTSAKGIVQLNVAGGAAKYDDFATLKDTTVPAIAAEVEVNTNAIDVLNGSNTTTGSVAKAVKDAIDALDFTSPSASSTTTSFIDTVSQTNGKISATKKTITSGSTSAKGIVQLSSTVDISEAYAATPKAVYTVNSKAIDAQSRVEAVENNYVRFNPTDTKLYVGKDGTDELIFDCGGAE